MANIIELKNILGQLNTEEVKSFSELDRVFSSIVSDNSKDLLESLDLLESFLSQELQKNIVKEV